MRKKYVLIQLTPENACWHSPDCYVGEPTLLTRNTLDCDQSNVYSSRAVFSAISQGLFRSSSFGRLVTHPHEISFESPSL